MTHKVVGVSKRMVKKYKLTNLNDSPVFLFLLLVLFFAVRHEVVEPEEVVLGEHAREVIHQLAQTNQGQDLDRKNRSFCVLTNVSGEFYHQWKDQRSRC